MTSGSDDQLAEVVRVEGSRILATLVRTVGSWSVAEDAVQEASIVALKDWAAHGLPRDPRAWLTVAARRKAIDLLRRERARTGKEREGVQLMELNTPDPPPDSVVRDDQLRLIFTCCHPALALDSQVALALRVLCQLPVDQVAAVLLTSEAAMAKRLTRVRTKITAAAIPYRVVDDAELPSRITGVCAVIHALYTAGHSPASGRVLVDIDVCGEAIRLARLLVDLMPDEATPAAVLALLLFSEARRNTRLDETGELVLLADQDRERWDRRLIEEATDLLNGSLRRTAGLADQYQLQAAIAAEHARGIAYPATDWAEIIRLYDLLVDLGGGPAATLARGVAVAELSGPAAGLAALVSLSPTPRVLAVRAELLAREGRYAEAVAAVTESLAGGQNDAERQFRERRRREWASRTG